MWPIKGAAALNPLDHVAVQDLPVIDIELQFEMWSIHCGNEVERLVEVAQEIARIWCTGQARHHVQAWCADSLGV